METKAQTIYEKISSILLTGLFILLPLFIIPNINLTFLYVKIGLATAVVLVSAILVVIHIINTRTLNKLSWLYVAALVSVPLAYLISALCSRHITLGLIGQGTDLDTFFFVALGMLLSVLVATVSKNKKQGVFMLSLSFSAVALLITLFHLIRFIFGPAVLSMGIFQSGSANTVGSFGDLGIYAGLALIISLISIEFLSFGKWIRAGFYALLVTSLAVVCVTNFNFVQNLWGTGVSVSLAFIVAIVALVVLVHKKVSNKADAKNLFPVVSLIVFLVALICTVEAAPVASFVLPHTGITQAELLDIRVAPADAGAVALKSLKNGYQPLILGLGPNRYFAAWGAFKPLQGSAAATPASIRQSDFNLSFSYIATSLVTEGLLGFLAWLFFFGVLIYYIYKLFRKVVGTEHDALARYSSTVVSVATVYLWLSAALYTPGPVILLLAFFFTGLLCSRLIAEGVISSKPFTWEEAGYWKSFSAVFAFVVCLALFVSAGYIWGTRALSSWYAQDALDTFQGVPANATDAQKDQAITSIQNYMAKAISLDQSGDYLRFYTEVSLIRPSEYISAATAPIVPSEVSQPVASDINRAMIAAQQATFYVDQTDYRNWIELGKVYETATFLGATSTGATTNSPAELSFQAYAQAEALNPTNPLPPFLVARVLIYGKNYAVAKQQLELALQINPGYTDAQTLLSELPANISPSPVSAALPAATSTSSK